LHEVLSLQLMTDGCGTDGELRTEGGWVFSVTSVASCEEWASKVVRIVPYAVFGNPKSYTECADHFPSPTAFAHES
jgi:hypothetical protein